MTHHAAVMLTPTCAALVIRFPASPGRYLRVHEGHSRFHEWPGFTLLPAFPCPCRPTSGCSIRLGRRSRSFSARCSRTSPIRGMRLRGLDSRKLAIRGRDFGSWTLARPSCHDWRRDVDTSGCVACGIGVPVLYSDKFLRSSGTSMSVLRTR